MKQWQKEAAWTLAAIVGIIMIFLAMPAESHNIIINNQVDTDHHHDEYAPIGHGHGGTPTITSGLGEADFAQALTQAYASGAHELDWSTTDLQLSFTYAMQFDGEEEDAYSVKFGKKELFGEKFLPQTMFHLTLNPEVAGLGNTLVFGGTVRIK